MCKVDCFSLKHSVSLQGVKVKFTEQNVFCKHFGTIFGVGWMGKGQNVENQNVESLKVDWKFEKDQNVKRTDKLDFRRSDHPKNTFDFLTLWCSDFRRSDPLSDE